MPLLYLSRPPSQSWNHDHSLKSWVEYLFPMVDGPIEDLQALVSEKKIAKVMKVGNHKDVPEEDDDEHVRGDVFLSFHLQASRPLSQQTLLAGYLSAWLKRCVVPSPPHNGNASLVIYPSIQLVHRCSLGLLSTMVCHIQSGLRMLMEQFCRRTTIT